MNEYEKLMAGLKEKHGNSKSVTDPDWNQVTSWTGYIPNDIRKAWKDIPHESQLLIYYLAGIAYRNGH